MAIDIKQNFKDDEKTRSDIEKYALTVIIIEATEYLPSFAYSIGLWEKFKHPELICFGLSNQTLHGLINDAAELVKTNISILTNKKYDDFLEDGDTEFIKVDPSYISDYFGYAIHFYRSDKFPALQLVWPDRKNRFPWDKDFEEEFIFKQPLLDRNTDFKFREERNVAIFTTRQWVQENKPILRVVHDYDGDWQFLTGDQTLADANIVALEQMTKRDPTLNEIFNLDYGEAADRNFIGDKWIRSICEKDEEEEDNIE